MMIAIGTSVGVRMAAKGGARSSLPQVHESSAMASEMDAAVDGEGDVPCSQSARLLARFVDVI